MMQQYRGVTSSTNAGEAFEAILLATVPSWSPSQARQVTPFAKPPSSPQPGDHCALQCRKELGEASCRLPH
jgi:hypothetical protein